MPQRIQRKRTKGWRMPEGAVYVGRPSKWGNPFQVERMPRTQVPYWVVVDPNRYYGNPVGSEREARGQAADLYRHWIGTQILFVRDELRGRDLACWCPLDQPCHADVLLEIANEGGPQ